MKFHYLLFALTTLQLESGSAFVTRPTGSSPALSPTELSAKARKSRRKAEKNSKGRSKQFYDAINDANGKETKSSGGPPDDDIKDLKKDLHED